MMQVDYKAFGRRLREYRHARNLTQEKLSELVGVSFQHAMRWIAPATRFFRILCPSRTSAFFVSPTPFCATH